MALLWNELAWPKIQECARQGYVVLLPVGTIEQHGYHLPVDIDAYNAYEVAKRVAAEVPKVIVAPPVSYGFSPSNAGFPGTLSLRPQTWSNLITEICQGIAQAGFKKIALVNGHGGNIGLAGVTADMMRRELGIQVLLVSWFVVAAKDIEELFGPKTAHNHAGEWETATQLYLRPHLASQGEPVANPYVYPYRFLGQGGVSMSIAREELTPSGAFGDPTAATGESGQALVERGVKKVAEIIRQYAAAA